MLTFIIVAPASFAATPLTTDESAFVGNLKLDVPGNLERSVCHVDMTHIQPKAAHWKGTMSAFYDRYILPAEEERIDRIATEIFSSPTGRPRTGAYPTGANPYLDEACILSAFPGGVYKKPVMDGDTVFAYLQALYLYRTAGCNTYDTILQDFELAGSEQWDMRNGPNPDDRYKQYRVPYAGYLASIATLKCTGDLDKATQQAQNSRNHMGDAVPPPIPLSGQSYDRLYLWR